jgi:hypothetical protein
MWRKSISVSLIPLTVLALASCSSKPYFVARDEPWRKDVEIACLRSGAVRESAFVAGRGTIDGPSACGAIRPYSMAAAMGGAISLRPPAVIQCAMVPAIERLAREIVAPAARYYYGMGVAEMKVVSSYSCRPRNGIAGGMLSEHGHANAVDIAAFTLVDGRTITVLNGWNGSPRDQAFLRAVHDGGCLIFKTVLGPNANSFHRDHFHFDLARHGRNGSNVVCE